MTTLFANMTPLLSLPSDFNTNFLMIFRWIHFVAGITWLGLLYFFNLVNVPLMKELDPPVRVKVMPALMLRWSRFSPDSPTGGKKSQRMPITLAQLLASRWAASSASGL
jgi:hypothetical protein